MDNIHYNYRAINGYPQPYKFIMCCREPGKTTNYWCDRYKNWLKNGRPSIFVVRQAVEITEEMINSICSQSINRHIDESVCFQYKITNMKGGTCDVKIDGKLFFRIIALSIPMQRIKKLVLNDLENIFFDEYIIDTRNGEKYLKNEAFKIKEFYTTMIRGVPEGRPLNMYFACNPYSLFNPMFVSFGIDTEELIKHRGGFYTTNECVIHWYLMLPELREKLLEKNPLYKFDEDYQSYALDGMPRNDKNIKISKHPNNFSLKWTIRYDTILIGIYQNNSFDPDEDSYYCEKVDEVSANRTTYCFDFENLVERTQLMTLNDRVRLNRFKDAMAKRKVSFESINIYYFMEEVYKML